MVEIFDISDLVDKNRDSIIYNLEETPPLKYIIENGSEESNPRFKQPMGIGYSEEREILAVTDFFNKRVELFKINEEKYEEHSSVSLTFYPNHVDLSADGNLLLISGSGVGGGEVIMYKYQPNFQPSDDQTTEIIENNNEKWVNVGKILPPPSLHPPLKSPRGLSIHSSRKYFAICDFDHHRILFFHLSTHELNFFCSYRPTFDLSPYSIIFKELSGISIDEDDDVIAVTDLSTNSVLIFQAPLFDQSPIP